MLQPLGLALPALRPKPPQHGGTPSTGGSGARGTPSPRERAATRSPAPPPATLSPATSEVKPASLRAPRLAAMGEGLLERDATGGMSAAAPSSLPDKGLV